MSDVPPPTEMLAETPAAPTELPPAHRAAADAAKVWADTLIDRTGRNELLFCKDRGKILLDGADPVVLDRLLHGEQVRLKQLFKDEIQKSYEEYLGQVGKEFAESTTHFRDALNDILAGGQKIF